MPSYTSPKIPSLVPLLLRLLSYFTEKKVSRNHPCVLSYSFFRNLSSLISTRIISSPICLIHCQGITYSLAGPNSPQSLPGTGTMIAVRHPVLGSNSTSKGHPRLLQVQILITSFCLRSQTRIIPPKHTLITYLMLPITSNFHEISLWYSYSFLTIYHTESILGVPCHLSHRVYWGLYFYFSMIPYLSISACIPVSLWFRMIRLISFRSQEGRSPGMVFFTELVAFPYSSAF